MVVPFGSARQTALPDDLSPDRDPEQEHPRRYVHGYHLLVLLARPPKSSSGHHWPATGFTASSLAASYGAIGWCSQTR